MPAATYTPADRARLLSQLAELRRAGWSFDRICAQPGWPSRPTLRKWLRRAPDISAPPLRRPSVRWSEAVADEICDRFYCESLREICEDEGMPDRKTLHKWQRARPDFAARLEAVRIEAGQPRRGRRSTYSYLVGEDVSDAVFETGTIAAACRLPGMPPARTVRDWVRAQPEFARWIEIAMETAEEVRLGPLLDAVRAWLDDPDADLKDAPIPRLR